MGYCIIISLHPSAAPPPGWGLNFSSYPPWTYYWKLHSPGLMTFIKYGSTLKNLVKNESLTPNAKNSIYIFLLYSYAHHQCKELHFFFYSIPRHIVNFYNLPATLNNPFKCNQFSLLLCSFLGHGRIDRYLVWIIILPWPCNRC